MPSHGSFRRVRRAVLDWYAAEHRDFPWRATRDPYAVLVSEVMLQQTQASRVAERFPRFLERFPTAAALAAASDAEVLVEWSGLGYNRRAIALKRTAVRVAVTGWPSTVTDLERLPGIGPYTARALASLAYGQPVGVVDTNVRRWLVRRFGLDPCGADGTRRALQALADALAGASAGPPSADEAAAWTHASMELGGAVCRSRRPRCEACPVAAGCPSRGRAEAVPVPRQASFTGSSRAWRGAILRAVATAPDHELSMTILEATVVDGAAMPFSEALAALERERLVHRRGPMLRLGAPNDAAGAAATIGR
ncbi:MAG TPA: A/G-specific adenine glycosylase [Candidatus Limnocylindria bacterium]|nr:A/G-specific adenine glycosylase [Candidatus Limnocylindria bacterium]